MRKIMNQMLAVSLCVASIMMSGCQKSEATKMSTVVKVETKAAETGNLKLSSDYIGTAAPTEEVDVTPLVSGTVTKVNVKVGDKVKKGDVLCKFDDTAAQYSVDSAKVSVQSAEDGKKSAQDQAAVSEAQTDASISTLQTQLDTYQSSLDDAQIQKSQLESQAAELKSTMESAQSAYSTAQTTYKSAESIYISYQSFLTANPDCQTTAGLAAATQEVTTDEVPVPTEKAKTAQALTQALSAAGLQVEYLTTAGLQTLQENAADAKSTYETAASSYSDAQSGISTLSSSIKTLNSQVSATKSSLENAKKTKGLSEKVTQDSVNSVDDQIDAANVGLDSAEYQADLYTVTAPMDGVIDTVNVTKNEVFGNGAAAFTISSKNAVLVTFYVTEEVKDFLKKGDEVTVENNDKNYKGSVTTISTSVDKQKGLFKIQAEVALEKNKKISSGSSVKLSLVTSEAKDSILVPYDCVYYEDDQAYVFCVKNNKAVRTDVETGLYNDETIEISSGLNEGDQVVTTWASGLKNGAKVEVKESK